MIYNVGGGGATSADKISYDNTESQLEATEVQGAIDEINTNLIAENNQRFKFGFDSDSEKYGYWIKEADTDVFVPFNGGEVYAEWITVNGRGTTTYTLKKDADIVTIATNLTANFSITNATHITNIGYVSGGVGMGIYQTQTPMQKGDVLTITSTSSYVGALLICY